MPTTPSSDHEKFVAKASPIEDGYVIAVWRDPHPTGHVPVSFPRLPVSEWSAEAADELLHSSYGYVTAPGSYWQELGEGCYGIRLRHGGTSEDADPYVDECEQPCGDAGGHGAAEGAQDHNPDARAAAFREAAELIQYWHGQAPDVYSPQDSADLLLAVAAGRDPGDYMAETRAR